MSADVDTHLARATELGTDAGEADAAWYFDGNTDQATYRRVLQGIEDGDPAILDTFPTSPLSGEWADQRTPAILFDEVTGDSDYDGDDRDDICQAFEDAYDRAVHATIEATCREMLS